MTVSELVQALVKAMNAGEVQPDTVVLTPDWLETYVLISEGNVCITDEDPDGCSRCEGNGCCHCLGD